MKKKAKLPLIESFEPYIGDTFHFPPFNIKVNGTLVDVSGDEFKLKIIEKASGDEFVTLELGSGITNPSTGRVQRKLTAAQTEDFVAGRVYLYDFQWTKAGGDNLTLERGELRPHKDITPP
jgi:hypothetical protein